ncbi:MAG: Hsp20/alpha crystallin family protein [bacterium]
MLWDLFHDIRDLQNEIDRLFEWPAALPRVYYTTSTHSNYPPMNLREDEENLYLDTRIPGLEKDDFQINIKNNTLSISGKKPAPENIEAKDYHRKERVTGTFIRAVALPVEVNPEKIQADYERGILSITLPKAESAKPKQISITVK